MKCAIREFEEESGLNIFNNISPLSETFNGTNNLMYKHIYYLSYSDKKIDFDKKFIDVSYEVSDIGWFNYYESIKNIRSYHVTKKLLIESILNFLVLYIININKNNNI
jgi:NADH pyrophosphatase NudC (nudix superfamily)